MVPSGRVLQRGQTGLSQKEGLSTSPGSWDASLQVQALPLTGTIASSVPPGSDSLTVQ